MERGLLIPTSRGRANALDRAIADRRGRLSTDPRRPRSPWVVVERNRTFIRTYDGRRVVIPDADLFTDTVVVNTAFEHRPLEYDVGIGYSDDIDRVRGLILEAVRGPAHVRIQAARGAEGE